MKISLSFFKRRSKAVCGCIPELEKKGSIWGLISVLIGYLKLSGLKHHLLPGIWECLLSGSHSRSLGFRKCQPPLQSGEGVPETLGDFQAPSLCCGLESLVPITWASPRGCFLSSQHGSSPTAGGGTPESKEEGRCPLWPCLGRHASFLLYSICGTDKPWYSMGWQCEYQEAGRLWGLLGSWPPPGRAVGTSVFLRGGYGMKSIGIDKEVGTRVNRLCRIWGREGDSLNKTIASGHKRSWCSVWLEVRSQDSAKIGNLWDRNEMEQNKISRGWDTVMIPLLDYKFLKAKSHSLYTNKSILHIYLHYKYFISSVASNVGPYLLVSDCYLAFL